MRVFLGLGQVWGCQAARPTAQLREWVSTVVLFPPLYVGRPLEFVPEAALEGLGLPL